MVIVMESDELYFWMQKCVALEGQNMSLKRELDGTKTLLAMMDEQWIKHKNDLRLRLQNLHARYLSLEDRYKVRDPNKSEGFMYADHILCDAFKSYIPIEIPDGGK